MKNITHVFAIRHGKYSVNSLTDEGIGQSKDTAAKIKDLLNGEIINIFHSPIPRAIETARIIFTELRAEKIRCLDELAGDEYSDGSIASERIEELIPEREVPTIVIAVGHFEALSGIIHGFASRHCGSLFECKVPHYGEGFWLDVKTRLIRPI